MKIALAVWNNRISPVFDVSRQILVVEIEDGIVTGNKEEVFINDDPLYKARKLAELDVQTLICGATSQPFIRMLEANNIGTISFISGNIDDVIAAYIGGTLLNPLFSMPGCRGRFYKGGRQGQFRYRQFDNSKKREDKAMPRGDGTGPAGSGPGTGKGKGRCGGGQGKQQGPCGGQNQGAGQNQGTGTGQGRKGGAGKGGGRGSGKNK